jgi:hypothetical protein
MIVNKLNFKANPPSHPHKKQPPHDKLPAFLFMYLALSDIVDRRLFQNDTQMYEIRMFKTERLIKIILGLRDFSHNFPSLSPALSLDEEEKEMYMNKFIT